MTHSNYEYFNRLVALFRGLGKPPVINTYFEFEGMLSTHLDKTKFLWDNPELGICDLEIFYNDKSYVSYHSDDFPPLSESDAIYLKVSLPQGDFQFVPSLKDFLALDNKLNIGEQVENVYLIEEDFIFGEDTACVEIERVLSISSLIKELSGMANYSGRIEYKDLVRIVYLDSSSSKAANPLIIEPKICLELLSYPKLNLTIFNDIKNEKSENAHIHEKRSMFRVSLIEVMNDLNHKENTFGFLIANWDVFVETYYANFEAYLTNFSFLKQKKEASENYINISSKISTTLSSISGKLFGLPISIGVALAILKSATEFEAALTLIGVGITSALLFFTILDQRAVLISIASSIEGLFSYAGNQKVGSLSSLIEKHKLDLYKQIQFLNVVMIFFIVISAFPFIVSMAVYMVKFNPDAVKQINYFSMRLVSQLIS